MVVGEGLSTSVLESAEFSALITQISAKFAEPSRAGVQVHLEGAGELVLAWLHASFRYP